jgi:hypothetical protein
MKCEFHCPDPDGDPLLKVCRVCSLAVRTTDPPERIHSDCYPRDGKVNVAAFNVIPLGTGETVEIPQFTYAERVKMFAAAMAKFIKSGMKVVTIAAFHKRTKICGDCQFRLNGACKLCTCNIAAKALMQSENCPLSLWPGDPPRKAKPNEKPGS